VDLLLTISELPEQLKQLIPQRAEGNPFYLEEIIRVLIDRGIIRWTDDHWQMSPEADLSYFEVPRTLQGLIMTRVDHLSEGSRQAIHCASVIGRDFVYRLLSAVLRDERNLQEDVRQLVDRELVDRVVQAADLEFRFHHVLTQETVYNSLLVRRREYLHRKIAEGIEGLFADRIEEHVEQMAFHYTESKNPERALPYLIRAGKRAADQFANGEALRYYQTAAEFLNQTTPTREQRVQVYQGLGGVQSFIGDYDGALNSYQIVLEIVRTSNYPQLHSATPEIMHLIGRVHERRGDYAEALRWLGDALTELDRDPASAQTATRVRVYTDTGWLHYRLGQFEDAYQWRMRALQIAEGTDYYYEMASAYNGLTLLFIQKGDWARAIAYAEKGLRLRETIGDTRGVSQSYNNLGIIALKQCDWDQALRRFQRAHEIRQKIGDIEGLSRLNNNLGLSHLYKGGYPRATEFFYKALDIAEKIKNGTLTVIALNDLAEAETLQGDFDSAILFLTRSIDLATKMESKEWLAAAQWALAEALFGQNQLAQAKDHAQQALTIASAIGGQDIQGQALRTLAKIARAQRDWDAADDYIQRSQVIFSELGNPFDLAQSQYQLALLQHDRGKIAEARATLETALATFTRLGAQAEQQRARAALDQFEVAAAPPAE
jgi:tetratricopeptide (TPR) repeat protein